jgi:twitching motility protein PilT
LRAAGRLVVPIEKKDRDLRLAMQNPRDKKAIAEIEQLTGLKVVPFLAPEMAIRRAHLLYRGNILDLLERSAAEAAGPATRAGGDRSAAELFSRILEYSVVARASDIHIEPYEVETLVRCRVDGVLHEVLSVLPAAHASLVARVKILATMRIDERRLPQDGRLEIDLSGLRMDIRVSSIPTARGEKLVLRLLAKEAAFVDLEDLGLASSDYDTLRANLLRPFGMILVTGPTGSGKTTTLYTMLNVLNQPDVNLVTAEDPVEYHLKGVTQVAVKPDIGYTFDMALRAFLRQDPDVILVGEMRDHETVETALLAAETGHLVFSTLHTLDATETINRIIAVFPPHQQRQMRIQLASVLKAAIAQRLLPRADGLGRIPAVEVMVATAFIRDCIIDKDRTPQIHGAIASGTSQYGMQTFDQSIFNLYAQGFVTLDEALRWATNVDEFKLKVQGISTTAEQARDEMAQQSGVQTDIIRFGS